MLRVSVSKSPLSTQRVELDVDGVEYILSFKWVSRYQRFYMSIFDSFGDPILQTFKLVPGAPINLANLEPDGPKGLFVMDGRGDIKRDSFETGAYKLYYIDRIAKVKFPLNRDYLIDTDIYEFILNYTASISAPDPEPLLFIDGDDFLFIDGDTFEFIT